MENNPKHKLNIQEKVLNKIRMDELTMRPRLYFTLKVVASVLLSLLVLTISVFLFNFIIFGIHESGGDSLLSFGSRGFWLFLQVFPWWILVVDAGLIVLLQLLLRQFSFGYKSPVLFLLGGLLVATLFVGFVVERTTTFNDFLRGQADLKHLPGPFNDLYERAGDAPSPGNTCRCTITAIEGNTIYADDIDLATTTRLVIQVPPNNANVTTAGLTVGEKVFIAGDRDGNTIEAFGIHIDNGGPKPGDHGHNDDGPNHQ
jgi:hypothetical protein